MNIWQIWFVAEEYALVCPEKGWSSKELRQFDGRAMLFNWEPVNLHRLEIQKALPLSDAPSFHSHLPVINKRAKDVLEHFLVNAAELLPVQIEGEDFWIVNVTNTLDCIDFEEAKAVRFSNGRVMRFEKYAFLESKVNGQNIFKIPEERLRCPFVSDNFKEAVERSRLTGFDFELVWSQGDG